MSLPRIKIKLLDEEALPPFRATHGSAGLDVFAFLGPGALEHLEFKAGEVKKVPLGFAMEIPPGYYADIRGRSGNNLAGDFQIALGTIDSDYRGPVCAIVVARKDFILLNGTKVAQMVVHKCEFLPIEMTTDELSTTARGEGGFGSTGQ